MRSHLLIVGQYTYPVHRERLLTGSGNLKTRFENLSQEQILGLVSDFSRVGKGDRIYFYVMKDYNLRASRNTLLSIYARLFNEICPNRRSKLNIINEIKAKIQQLDNPEIKLIGAINSEIVERNAEFPENTYRYLLEILGNVQPGLQDGFHGTFIVQEEPYLMKYTSIFELNKNVYGINDFSGNMINNYLWMRIKVRPEILFYTSISEFDLLDDFSDEITSWTLIYRKLFGLRSCTSIPPIEEQKVFRLLNNRNPIANVENNIDNIQNQIITTITSGEEEFSFKPAWDNNLIVGAISIKDFISNMNLVNTDNLYSESLLESNILYEIVNLEYDTTISSDVKDKFRDLFEYPESKVIWVGNQVVCSAGGSRSDIVVFHSNNNSIVPDKISVIELKNVSLGLADINQVGKYARWLSTTYLNRDIRNVRHILIGWSADMSIDNAILNEVMSKEFQFPVNIFTYRLQDGKILFTRHL